MMSACCAVQFLFVIATGFLFSVHVQCKEEESYHEIECGKTTVSSGRIQGGEEVERHSIPWQVAIFNHVWSDWKPYCGGVLISPSHVLTAAHCIKDCEDCEDCSAYSVGVGMHKANVSDGTRIKIKHIRNHPNYKTLCATAKVDFDYSIVHLASPVQLNNKVRPACLPDESLDEKFLAGKNLTVSGWGKPYPGVLHKAHYPAHTNEDCKKYNEDGSCNLITANMLCAGDPENRVSASDNGDSGGPLTYNNDGHETVVGLVSWSDKCWDTIKGEWTGLCDGKLSVYSRVTAQLEWIEEEMKKNYDMC